MAQYFRVAPRIWSEAWDDDSRLLALYVLTCPHRTTEGLFRLPKGYVMEDLHWSAERLAKPFGKLLAEGFMRYDDHAQVILICKALKWQAPENPNQEKAALAALEDLPQTPLLQELQRFAERFAQRFAQRLAERFGYSPSPSPSPDPDPDPGAIAPVSAGADPRPVALDGSPVSAPPVALSIVPPLPTPQRIVDMWGEVCGDRMPKAERLTDGRRDKIRSRLLPDRDETWWQAYFGRIRASPHCCGETPSRNGQRAWRATFDWAIESEGNVAKVLEGNYDARGAVANGVAGGRVEPGAFARPESAFTAGLYRKG